MLCFVTQFYSRRDLWAVSKKRTRQVCFPRHPEVRPRFAFIVPISWANQEFDENASRVARTEEVQVLNPLIARYQMSDALAFYLRSTWVKRSSPKPDRKFDATIVKLGLNLTL